MKSYCKATALEVLRPYAIKVTFEDGSVRELDLEPELYGQMFEPLKDYSCFSQASIDPVFRHDLLAERRGFEPRVRVQGRRTSCDDSVCLRRSVSSNR